MYIRIHTTVQEMREWGLLENVCKLFNYDTQKVQDNQPIILTQEQAGKIGLSLTTPPASGPYTQPETMPKKRIRKAK